MSGSEPEPPGKRDQIIFTAHVLVLVFDTKSFKVSLEETGLQERGMGGGYLCSSSFQHHVGQLSSLSLR